MLFFVFQCECIRIYGFYYFLIFLIEHKYTFLELPCAVWKFSLLMIRYDTRQSHGKDFPLICPISQGRAETFGGAGAQS